MTHDNKKKEPWEHVALDHSPKPSSGWVMHNGVILYAESIHSPTIQIPHIEMDHTPYVAPQVPMLDLSGHEHTFVLDYAYQPPPQPAPMDLSTYKTALTLDVHDPTHKVDFSKYLDRVSKRTGCDIRHYPFDTESFIVNVGGKPAHYEGNEELADQGYALYCATKETVTPTTLENTIYDLLRRTDAKIVRVMDRAIPRGKSKDHYFGIWYKQVPTIALKLIEDDE